MTIPKTASSKTASKAVVPGGFTQLAASGAFFRRMGDTPGVKGAMRGGRLKRWALRLLAVAVALVVLGVLFVVAVGITTNALWFDSVHAGSVYSTMIRTKVLLFCVFAVIGGVIGGLTMYAVTRIRPRLDLSPDYDTFRVAFRRVEPRLRKPLVAAATLVPAILLGRAASGGWQTFLLWHNATSFGRTDPLFHRDASFYVEVWPFHQLVVGLLLQGLGYALWIAVIAGYWYAAWRIRRGSQKITVGITRLVSSLGAVFLFVKAYAYWESRYAVTTATGGPVTGAGYTDTTAVLPTKYALMAIALLGGVVLVLNAVRVQRLRVLGGTAIVVALVVSIVGAAVPGLVYHYREAPSAASLDLGEIENNVSATRAAFGLDRDVTTKRYDTARSTSTAATQQLAGSVAQASVIDPNQLSPTFNVKQQLQAYYGFKSTLDTSHYTVNGRSQDVALAVREMQPNAVPSGSWVNRHLVYTHGYGVVAAPTTEVDPTTSGPVFFDAGIPPARQIPVNRPQVYYGQGFSGSSFAIVGRPAGSSRNLEFDHPAGRVPAAHTTYRGSGGVPLGSTWRRLFFAVQMTDPNILFSSDLNSASQLLEVRDPAARVAKIAPWLTLDGDVYPAVVGGHIKWVVDGYTTSSTFPDSQLTNLRSATSTTLVADGASNAQANTKVNYMKNSVKAVVDAYTGRVSLYEWNQAAQPDPLLKTWEAVFPHLVQPQSRIPAALTSQLRYPTDLFNVQRSLLARYHVTNPSDFYNGNDFWSVPTDPTIGGNGINASSAGTVSAPLPSKYMSQSADGFGAQRYSLSSPMATLNGRDLAAFVSVDSEPGPDYGKFSVLDFPSGSSGGVSPSQVQNNIESNTTITEALTLQRGGNSKVVLGDLEAIPVAGRMLYVEPVYTQSSGAGSFPVLRHVIALYADGQPSFENTLSDAIASAVKTASNSTG